MSPVVGRRIFKQMTVALGVWNRIAKMGHGYQVLDVSKNTPSAFDLERMLPEIHYPPPVECLLSVAPSNRNSRYYKTKDTSAQSMLQRLDIPFEYVDKTSRRERVARSPAHTTYHVKVDQRMAEFYGAERSIPGFLEPRLQRGALMTNKCDFAVYTLKPLVSQLVRHIDPGTTVKWLTTIPQPRVVFQFPGNQAALHSVLLITTALGERYVLDPTGEQFGIPQTHLFTPFWYYESEYIAEREYWSPDSLERSHVRVLYPPLKEQAFEAYMDLPGFIFWKAAREQAEETGRLWTEDGYRFDLPEVSEQNLRRRLVGVHLERPWAPLWWERLRTWWGGK
ncbi:hypothetical protein BU24DRAFT_405923 [Aaosphaeria arxii CBS 175.79]|uniref:Uncharacterized protein n=1 Tax=Aaosphaeria arxii CBS 175.79 TaxID=1450172 RepID=A0A6A5Y2U8_9PLEO|nr:uncharacterized protein BU24DRAFT_405923 [Aaosphaeria arxii CBS 175.79]KAF2019221.1 hypothetical protein BU24DRAFT_405923 [Aaosphaeria arxii CBS 175.79]